MYRYDCVNINDCSVSSLYYFEYITDEIFLREYGDSYIYLPLIVLKDFKFVIEGVSRFNFLKSRGVSSVNVLFFDNDDKVQQIIASAFYRNNIFPLNIIEKTKLVVCLRDCFNLSDDALVDLLGGLGENCFNDIVNVFYDFKDIVENIKAYIVRMNVGLKLVRKISSYNIEDQYALSRYLNDFRLNVSQFKVFLDLISDLIEKNNTSMTQIINLLYDYDKHNRKDITISFRHNLIIKKLYNILYPNYQKQLSRIRGHISKFKLRPYWKINLPNNLEGEGIELNFKIKNYKEYLDVLNILNNVKDNQLMGGLFDLL